MTKPNPGSKEAVEQGCSCAVIDNYYGQGVPYPDGPQFWINADCPLHGEEANDPSRKTSPNA